MLEKKILGSLFVFSDHKYQEPISEGDQAHMLIFGPLCVKGLMDTLTGTDNYTLLNSQNEAITLRNHKQLLGHKIMS